MITRDTSRILTNRTNRIPISRMYPPRELLTRARITAARIMAAKQLLTDSELQVREIADRLGFASQGYFGRFFRNKTGLTPNAYREAEKRKQ